MGDFPPGDIPPQGAHSNLQTSRRGWRERWPPQPPSPSQQSKIASAPAISHLQNNNKSSAPAISHLQNNNKSSTPAISHLQNNNKSSTPAISHLQNNNKIINTSKISPTKQQQTQNHLQQNLTYKTTTNTKSSPAKSHLQNNDKHKIISSKISPTKQQRQKQRQENLTYKTTKTNTSYITTIPLILWPDVIALRLYATVQTWPIYLD